MQHRPIVSYVRTVGFVIGFILFVLMAYHMGQTATSKQAVAGKRSVQQLVAAEASQPMPSSDVSAAIAATVSYVPAPTPSDSVAAQPVAQTASDDTTPVITTTKHDKSAEKAARHDEQKSNSDTHSE